MQGWNIEDHHTSKGQLQDIVDELFRCDLQQRDALLLWGVACYWRVYSCFYTVAVYWHNYRFLVPQNVPDSPWIASGQTLKLHYILVENPYCFPQKHLWVYNNIERRMTNKRSHWKIFFFISQKNQMLWILVTNPLNGAFLTSSTA